MFEDGHVPAPQFEGPEASITGCTSAGTVLTVAGEVTNTATVTRTLLSLRFDVFDAAGRNVDPDRYFGIGGIGTAIGPGMKSRVAGTTTLRSTLPADVNCRVRPNVFLPGADQTGSAATHRPGDAVRVRRRQQADGHQSGS